MTIISCENTVQPRITNEYLYYSIVERVQSSLGIHCARCYISTEKVPVPTLNSLQLKALIQQRFICMLNFKELSSSLDFRGNTHGLKAKCGHSPQGERVLQASLLCLVHRGYNSVIVLSREA